MRFCSHRVRLSLAGLAIAAGVSASEPVHKVASVVRADPRTGRLVRSVVVSPRTVRENVVKPASPENASAPRTEPTRLGEYIEETARRYQVEPALVHSVIEVESNYNPFAISPKGAEGIMQLMPGTAKRFQVANSFNPWQNIDGGVRYLKYLLNLFGNERLALAAYNAGEGAVIKYGDVPPYAETNQYVYRVGRKLGAARQSARKPEADHPKASTPEQPSIVHYTDADGREHFETRTAP